MNLHILTQTLYEAVCSDRNLCSKNLIEARDEITEMKRKLKIMSHQIDQLKEEIASKVHAFVLALAKWNMVSKRHLKCLRHLGHLFSECTAK